MRRSPQPPTPSTRAPASLLHQLVRRHGIQPVYRDESGNRRVVLDASLKDLLRIMGVYAGTPQQVRQSLAASKESQWTKLIEETFVIPQSKLSSGWTLHIPQESGSLSSMHLTWIFRGEKGFRSTHRAGGAELNILARKHLNGRQYLRVHLPFPRKMPLGSYTLQLSIRSPSFKAQTSSRLLITPDKAYAPSAYAKGRRLWGLTVQLYGIRSLKNWGIGDFRDLNELILWAGKDLKAAMVGVNPLHALLPGFLLHPATASES